MVFNQNKNFLYHSNISIISMFVIFMKFIQKVLCYLIRIKPIKKKKSFFNLYLSLATFEF
jgi:hypothetical protein